MTCEQRGHDFGSWLAGCLPLAAPVASIPPSEAKHVLAAGGPVRCAGIVLPAAGANRGCELTSIADVA